MSPALVLLAYDPNNVRPGWVALILVVALGIATYLLWRSMNTQLRKISAPTKAELRERAANDSTAGDRPVRRPDDEAPDPADDPGERPTF